MVVEDNETATGLDPNAATADAVHKRRAPPSAPARRVGRFTVLSLLGEGGMGSVYAAYDEQLDRKVALKILHREVDHDARVRMLREAQSMAKVDHPSVVKVFEAGEHEQQLYIAMEFIDGKNLSQWGRTERPTWREVLGVYIRAGHGLAAAHAVGLVHRDFKPLNVMIDARAGDTGGHAQRRVRVLDFGLAGRTLALHASSETQPQPTSGGLDTPLTQTGAMMGTPAYMAPEQIAGQPSTDRTDQFSFCVALWEQLFDQRPFGGASALETLTNVTEGRRKAPDNRRTVPSWLAQALDRGLAVDARLRWPSMAALLAALERGNNRGARRRRLAAGVGIAGLAVGALLASRGESPCQDAAAPMLRVWSDAQRASIRAAMASVGAEFAPQTAAKTDARLADYAAAWQAARLDACDSALVRGEQSTAILLQRNACLDQRLRAFEALVDVLQSPSAAQLDAAAKAAAELPSLWPCADVKFVAAEVPPPTDDVLAAQVDEVRVQLAHAHALRQAGDYAAAAELAEAQVARAQTLRYEPLRAEANNEAGWALHALARFAEARARARAAYLISSRASRDVRADNHRLLASLARTLGAIGEAEIEANKALIVLDADSRPPDEDLATSRALLASIIRGAGRLDEALALDRDVLEQRRRLFEPDHPAIADSASQIAATLVDKGQYRLAIAQYERAIAIRRAAFGPQHPEVARGVNDLGIALQHAGRHEEALAAALEALAVFEAALGPEHPESATCRGNVAAALLALGRNEEALAAARRSVQDLEAAFGPTHPRSANAHGHVGTILHEQGKYAEALTEHQRTLEVRIATLGPEHPRVALSLANIGGTQRALGNYQEALDAQQRALGIRQRVLGPAHPDVGSSLSGVGSVLLDLHRFEEALHYYERALAIAERALGPDHPDLAFEHNNLGTVLDDLDRLDEALAHHQRALEIRLRHLGPDHPDVANSYNNLGSARQDRGDYKEAIGDYTKSLELVERTLGPSHPAVALAHNNIGVAHFMAGEIGPAIESLRAAREVWQAAHGMSHPDVASAHYSLGNVLRSAGRHDEALLDYELAVASFDAATQPVVTDHVIALAMVAITAARTGARAKAEAALARVQSEAAAHRDTEVVQAIAAVTTAMVGGPSSRRDRAPLGAAIGVLQANREGRFAKMAQQWVDEGSAVKVP